MSKALLQIKNLSFSYKKDQPPILREISFNLSSNISMGIIGPNGGGKSTLLKVLSGNLKPNKQIQIIFNNKKVGQLNPRSDFSYLPQEKSFKFYFPITVYDFLQQGLIGLLTTPIKLDEVLSIFDLTNLKNQLFEELSGGQKQKVLIARVFLRNTPLVFLDEPTLGLDGNSNDQLLKMIKEIKSRHHFGVLIVDHHIDKLIDHCEQILCLNKTGHWHSPSEELSAENISQYYHCEYEHLLLHKEELKTGINKTHKKCSVDHEHSIVENKGKLQ